MNVNKSRGNDIHQAFKDATLHMQVGEEELDENYLNEKYGNISELSSEDKEDYDFTEADNVAYQNVQFDSNAGENEKFSDSDFMDGARPSYLDLNNLLMFPQSNLYVNDVMEMLLGYFIQFNVTEKARSKLIEVIKILAGPQFQNINFSNYTLNKILNPPEDKVTFHYYCQSCEGTIVHSSVKSAIKKQEKFCEKCETKNIIGLSNQNYFLSVNFEYQLQLLLKEKSIRESLLQTVSGTNRSNMDDKITDICDSKLYRDTVTDFPSTVTYNISTDGAPLSDGRSSNRSFWPLSVVINDLPPTIRFKHVLLVGIMIVAHEPQPSLMNLFIDKFKEQAVSLHEKGIKLNFPEDNCTQTLTFSPLCIIADSAARPLLQNRLKYNGYCSCRYCYQLGFHCGIVKFPFVGSDCTQRTHKSHMADVRAVEAKGSSVNGVKGRSAFCDFPNIDMVKSFSLDGMHNGIIGCSDQMWELMSLALTKTQRRDLDNLLMKIQPTRELHRVPAPLSKKKCWKATHWKAWMLYHSVPLLMEVNLRNDWLKHYMLFVSSMFILNKTNISRDDLIKCKEYLLTFVA